MSSAAYSYGLEKSSSAAIMRANSMVNFWPGAPRYLDNSFKYTQCGKSQSERSLSVQDVTGYYRPFQRNRPLWLSQPYQRPVRLRQQYPFRRERNKQMAEMYWRDRYYYYSPLYKRAETGYGRPFESEFGSHIYSYWARYNGYGYDRKHPGFYRHYYYPIGDYYFGY